jgi:Thioredoxin
MAVDQHHTQTGLTPEQLRERFAGGATRQRFAASLPDGGRRLAELEAMVGLDPSTSAFARVREELNVLAIVEGWCRDSKDGSAVLLRLVGDNPSVRVRFFPRGEHPELMAAYRKDGRFDSIPVFVFLDGAFNETGRYVERPGEVTTMHEWHRAELARRDPEFAPADAPRPRVRAGRRAAGPLPRAGPRAPPRRHGRAPRARPPPGQRTHRRRAGGDRRARRRRHPPGRARGRDTGGAGGRGGPGGTGCPVPDRRGPDHRRRAGRRRSLSDRVVR